MSYTIIIFIGKLCINSSCFEFKVVSHLELVTSTSKAYSADETRHIQNCIALLTRLVPAGFEQFDLPDQLDSFEQRVFWTRAPETVPRDSSVAETVPRDSSVAETVPRDSSVAETVPRDSSAPETVPRDSGVDEGANNSATTQPEPANHESAPLTAPINSSESAPTDNCSALAPRILSLVIKLLFLPHFTAAVHHPQIWYSGVGVPADAKISSTTAAMASNRVLTLQLLLAVLSHDLFLSPALYFKRRLRNAWLDYLTHPPRDSTIYGQVPHVLYSLLNTALRYDPIGWGVPYNHLLFSDQQEELLYKVIGDRSVVTDIDLLFKALQVLALTLNYSADPWTEDDAPFTEQQAEISATDNLFIATLREISDRSSLDQLYGMFTALFGNPLRANSTYLPNSAKELNCHPELLILFWALIRNHPVSCYFLLWNIQSVLTCQI